jgi:hypothetical protein
LAISSSARNVTTASWRISSIARLVIAQEREHGGEREPALGLEPVGQLRDLLADAQPIDQDVVGDLDLGLPHHAVEGLDQLVDRERREGRDRVRVDAIADGILGGRAATPHVATDDRALAELVCGLLVLLVLEQALDEVGTRVDLDVIAHPVAVLALFLERLGRRQELARLDVAQGRRHHQVLAGDVDVEAGHRVEVLEVLLGDERDRDVEDRELVLLDQVQEQIERPLEHVEGNGVATVHDHIPNRPYRCVAHHSAGTMKICAS